MALIETTLVSKSFGGVRALDGVTFTLEAGEIHALAGENGAGKSTLIKVLGGALEPDSGTVRIDGAAVETFTPAAARRAGVAVISQQPALFHELTVAENIGLALEAGSLWRRIDWNTRKQQAKQMLERVGADISPDALVRDLSMPQQQLVEIAKALGLSAKVLILDEPTASLTGREVDRLLDLLRGLRAAGTGILYVSHRLDEMFEVADRVTVLRDGQPIATRAIGSLDRSALIALMAGRETNSEYPEVALTGGKCVLETRNLGCASTGVSGINLSVRSGEIFGIAGLVGSGRTELAQILFGLTPADSGEILLNGTRVRIGSPGEAVKLGIAYTPEDRKRQGAILAMTVAENTSLACLGSVSNAGWLNGRKEANLARVLNERLDTKAPSVHTVTGDLSGGNQQKVVLARWLATKPSVILLDEPTQGVDVGAKAEIHRLIAQLALDGAAVILISSELPEVLGLAHRVAVMRSGRLAGVLERAEAKPEAILALAFGSVAA
jgi:rhamnose transport system ATP-binding protein